MTQDLSAWSLESIWAIAQEQHFSKIVILEKKQTVLTITMPAEKIYLYLKQLQFNGVIAVIQTLAK